MAILAKIGIIGDMHLCSKNYGGHSNYQKESIEYFTKISDLTEQLGLTHLIGTGDFTYGKFDKLEYREAIERELERQNRATNGNRYEIEGNHDTATNGRTEYQYYIGRGLLKPATNMTIGSLAITMLDYRKSGVYTEEDTNIVTDGTKLNAVIAHQYFKFKDTQLPNFGDAIELDDYTALYGTDFLICGHIHHIMAFNGLITKDNNGHRCTVQYMGCMMRPAYREGHMDTVGNMTVLTVHDNGQLEYDVKDIQLWKLEESFNLEEKALEVEKKIEKESRVDISDVVKQLDAHDRNIGNPEDIIKSLSGIDEKYKNKAIELLKNAL